MVVSDDKKEAVVFYFRTLAQPNPALRRVRLQGLDPALDYRFEGYPTPWGGDLLMHYGWPVPQVPGDFVSFRFRLTAG
jgi:alpha-galactosidase